MAIKRTEIARRDDDVSSNSLNVITIFQNVYTYMYIYIYIYIEYMTQFVASFRTQRIKSLDTCLSHPRKRDTFLGEEIAVRFAISRFPTLRSRVDRKLGGNSKVRVAFGSKWCEMIAKVIKVRRYKSTPKVSRFADMSRFRSHAFSSTAARRLFS